MLHNRAVTCTWLVIIDDAQASVFSVLPVERDAAVDACALAVWYIVGAPAETAWLNELTPATDIRVETDHDGRAVALIAVPPSGSVIRTDAIGTMIIVFLIQVRPRPLSWDAPLLVWAPHGL